MLLELPEVLLGQIAGYASPKTLGLSLAAAKAFAMRFATDAQWRRCVLERWYFRPRTPQAVGAATWARAYREMERRGAAPRTRVSPRHAKVFAKGRTTRTAGWVFVDHAQDTRTRVGPPRFVSLRVLVQNVDALVVRFDPNDAVLTWSCGPEDDAVANATVAGARDVLAFSSRKRACWPVDYFYDDRHHQDDDDDHLKMHLPTFDWLAFSLKVETKDCFWELDFLERARCLVLPVTEVAPPLREGGADDDDDNDNDNKAKAAAENAPKVSAASLVLSFVGPAQLDSWYSHLPGGCIMLANDDLRLA